jgi:cobalt-zinc-cadmium efflux system protein
MRKEQAIAGVILFNLAIIVSEVVFGWIGNSYALIADAVHNAGDVLAIGVTYVALRVSAIKPDFHRTYGFVRAEMMATFVNTLFLIATMLYLMVEAIGRIGHPETVDPFYMITVGSVAMIANGISAYVLHRLGVSHCAHAHEHETHRHHHHEDANIRSAYLHMLSDALISAGVIVAGVSVYVFAIDSIDAIVTLIVSVYILTQAYPLLKKSFLSLMDMNTTGVAPDTIDAILRSEEAVVDYHDLHISAPGSHERYISFHLVFDDDTKPLRFIEQVTDTIRSRLKQLGFNHIVIQSDARRCVADHHYCTGVRHVSV